MSLLHWRFLSSSRARSPALTARKHAWPAHIMHCVIEAGSRVPPQWDQDTSGQPPWACMTGCSFSAGACGGRCNAGRGAARAAAARRHAAGAGQHHAAIGSALQLCSCSHARAVCTPHSRCAVLCSALLQPRTPTQPAAARNSSAQCPAAKVRHLGVGSRVYQCTYITFAFGPAVAPLEGYGAHEWVCFERALVVRDLFTGGTRTFHSTPDAQDFRAALYQQYGA